MTESENPLESTEVQIIALLAVVIGVIISITIVLAVDEQQSGKYPGKDYSYIQELAKTNTLIILATAVYFAWLAWLFRERNPEVKAFEWLFTATVLGVLAAVIKLVQAYSANLSATQEEEEVEEVE